MKKMLLFLLLLLTGCAAHTPHQPHAGTAVPVPKAVTTPSGLTYLDLKIGSGVEPIARRSATVHYTGTLENGKKFDSSVDRGQPFEFAVGTGAVIRGWDEGIMGMKEGGVRRLIIPPSLGYGMRRIGSDIPPNSTLIFEIELLEVDELNTLERLLDF